MFIEQRFSNQLCVTGGINIWIVKGRSKIAFRVLWVPTLKQKRKHHEDKSPSGDIRWDKKITRKKTRRNCWKK